MDTRISFASPLSALLPIQPPHFAFDAAVYFVDGNLLFQRNDQKRGIVTSKFITIHDLQAACTGLEQDTGWMVAGVVRSGNNSRGNWFVYSAPAQKVKIIFDGETDRLTVPIPRTVLMGIGNEYYLWALTSDYFEPVEIAHNAPFPNINPDGLICWGGNTPPSANAGNARKVWELFFSSPFNAHLIQNHSKEFPGDVREKLRSLNDANRYPLDDLVRERNSIGFMVDQLVKG
jgi:hypothetical protein